MAVYGHDFTVRAGSMDATNGSKLARLFRMAGEKGIPLIGMNDSAGAFVPAGVGGLDGYAEAFTALRKISGVVPSIMCMFGFNAGGGSYLPRQGSFVIQPNDTFFGLTGPGVVKSVLGEDITPEELGGPKVHGNSGVADLTVADELAALRQAVRLLAYIPDNNWVMAPFQETSDPLDRKTWEINTLLKKAFNSPTGFNTPFDVSIIIQQICDYGDYFELQPERAREAVTAFGRLGGHVVGFVANNSAVGSGQIDCDSALQDRQVRPLLQHLQHPHHLHGGHHRLPPRPRAGGPRHRAGRPLHARLHRRRAHAAHPAHPPQRLRRRLRLLQQLPDRRRPGAGAPHHPSGGHGAGRQGVRLQGRGAEDPRRGRRPGQEGRAPPAPPPAWTGRRPRRTPRRRRPTG